MTDKEKIRKEVERLINELIQEKVKGFGSDADDACILELQNVLTYIESLQEEPAPKILEDMLNAKTPAESLGISQEEHDRIVDECIYGKEPELVDVDDLPNKEEEPVRIKKGCKYRCLSDMQNTDTGAISFFKDKIYSAPKDDTLVSEEDGWLCDTSENASNFELVEEPVSEDNTLRKASEEYLKVLSETPYNNTPITNAQTIVRGLITFLDNPSKYNPNHIEEPVSEDWLDMSKIDCKIQYANIESGIHAHAEDYSFNIESQLFNQLTKEQQELWRKEIEQAVISGGHCGVELARDKRYKENQEPVSEDLELAATKYAQDKYMPVQTSQAFKAGANWQKEQFEKNRLAACDKQTEEEAEIERDFFMSIIENEHRQPTFDDAIKYGMRLQKEQMTEDAVSGKVIARFPLASDPLYNDVEIYLNFTRGLSEGDKVKVIVIKEMNEL